MRYNTLEKYDKELGEMESELIEIEEYLKKHPKSFGTKGNYETLQYVYNLFKKDKIDFINKVNKINLKMSGNLINQGVNITDFIELANKFNEMKNLTATLSDINFNRCEDLLMESISEGSYKITFGFPNPTEEDVLRKSPRKKGLMKIFDFINCGDDIEKLKKEAGFNGHDALIAYKEFLMEIVKNQADFTLDTEMGTVKAGLTLQQCKNICENLNI